MPSLMKSDFCDMTHADVIKSDVIWKDGGRLHCSLKFRVREACESQSPSTDFGCLPNSSQDLLWVFL